MGQSNPITIQKFARWLCLCVVFVSLSGCTALTTGLKVPVPVGGETNDPDFQFGIARSVERNGKLEDAARSYRQLIEKHNYPPALHRLGVISLKQEKVDEAFEWFDRALQASADPDSDLYCDIGYAHYLVGDHEKAESNLREALRRNPDSKRAANNLALTMGRQNRMESAYEIFRKHNSEAESIHNVGFIQSQMSQYEQAMVSFQKALDLAPDLKIAAKSLLQVHQQTAAGEQQPVVGAGVTTQNR